MTKEKYQITKSNYVLRRKHQSLPNGGTIYERDFMALTNLGGFDGEVFPLENNNFKFVTNDDAIVTRARKYGEWVKCNGKENWTMDNLPSVTEHKLKNDSRIVLKPNYNSLLDFAYYGSCTELIEATVKDVIKHFPGELYFSNIGVKYKERDGSEHWLGEGIFNGFSDTVEVENPFKIDITSHKKENEDDDDLRYFFLSKGDYAVLREEVDNPESMGKSQYKLEVKCGCASEWSVEHIFGDDYRCLENGDCIDKITFEDIEWCVRADRKEKINIVIYSFYLNGEIRYISDKIFRNYHIRPTDFKIDEYFNGLDDFGAVMLNRDTNPIYTMRLDTPYETENGTVTYKRNYTWPNRGGWNLDFTGKKYEMYIKSLIKVSKFYDSKYTNNLWNMMTHEAIKNLDQTYQIESRDGEDISDVKIGYGKIEAFLLTCGRFFDDMKREIDTIKYTTNVSYNENNNIPDYFLTDILSNKGWEVYNSTSTLDPESRTSLSLFKGLKKRYDISETNTQFLRNLFLNSTHIMRKKGTQYGIECLLALFGLKSYNMLSIKDRRSESVKELCDYRIDEYVAVADTEEKEGMSGDYEEELDIEKYNTWKKNAYDGDNTEVTLDGLPVRMVYFETPDESGGTRTIKYVIPWVDRNVTYDGNIYFQMYGGWNKHLDPNLVKDTKISAYGETKKYLKIVPMISDLTKQNGADKDDIYYVNNIDDIKEYFPDIDDDEITNYFVLRNKEGFNFIGGYSVENNDIEEHTSLSELKIGWEPIPKSSIEGEFPSREGIRVLYLRSIIEEWRGNNPHVGYGKYDSGQAYVDYFRKLFKYSIENDNFNRDAYDCGEGTVKSGITELGFNITEEIDNGKCWYFSDTIDNDKRLVKLQLKKDIGFSGNMRFDVNHRYLKKEENGTTRIGANSDGHYDSSLKPYNLENGKKNDNDVAASFSVINTKKLKLTFFGHNNTTYGEFEQYLNKCILPYIMQIIPSTTILEVCIDGEEAEYLTVNVAVPMNASHECQANECIE